MLFRAIRRQWALCKGGYFYARLFRQLIFPLFVQSAIVKTGQAFTRPSPLPQPILCAQSTAQPISHRAGQLILPTTRILQWHRSTLHHFGRARSHANPLGPLFPFPPFLPLPLPPPSLPSSLSFTPTLFEKKAHAESHSPEHLLLSAPSRGSRSLRRLLPEKHFSAQKISRKMPVSVPK
ncbi:unnamed protein product [Protopolystoma xenopodis]|uniref:Uncharacterized protein n=1 Tax=Protopolystoma xenopodis TaxID=117903 RepID=A0A3S5A9I4_9PLAT|nr:unnamed protein product [Protopolystoma xenopodis]